MVCSRRLSILTCPPFSRYSTSSARKGERCRGAYISIREDEKKQRASAVTTARPRDPKTRDGSIYAYTSARRRAPAAAPPPPAPMSPAPPSAPQRTGARARAAEVLRCSSSRDPHCHNHSLRGGGRESARRRAGAAPFSHTSHLTLTALTRLLYLIHKCEVTCGLRLLLKYRAQNPFMTRTAGLGFTLSSATLRYL